MAVFWLRPWPRGHASAVSFGGLPRGLRFFDLPAILGLLVVVVAVMVVVVAKKGKTSRDEYFRWETSVEQKCTLFYEYFICLLNLIFMDLT